MTAQLSLTPGLHKERLNHIRASYVASKQGHAFIGHPSYDEQIAIIDTLLAGMDSEPVAWQYRVSAGPATGWSLWHEGKGEQYEKSYQVERRALYAAPPAPVIPFGLHPDTQKLVTDFCTALAEKLYKAQLKYGYDADWKRDGWPSQCQAHFHQHIAKGDPRDVAAYCAFMWYHGWKTEPAPVAMPDEQCQHLSELYHAQEKRLFKLAQRLKGPSFDKYAYSPSQAIDVLESAIFGEKEDDGSACRAAMQSFGNSEQPVSQRYTLTDGWISEAKNLADLHGLSFVVFRKGEEPQCADPSKVIISFTDEGLGYPAAPEQEV